MKTIWKATCAIAPLLLLGACAAGSAASHHAAEQGSLSIFLLGIWHGMIAPVALIVEVINRLAPHALPWTLKLYETTASSAEYDVGFYFGLMGSPLVAWNRWSSRSGRG